jgi:hypothetical protein
MAYDYQSGEQQAREAGIPPQHRIIVTDMYSERQLQGLHGCRMLNGNPDNYGGDLGFYLRRACMEM